MLDAEVVLVNLGQLVWTVVGLEVAGKTPQRAAAGISKRCIEDLGREGIRRIGPDVIDVVALDALGVEAVSKPNDRMFTQGAPCKANARQESLPVVLDKTSGDAILARLGDTVERIAALKLAVGKIRGRFR